MVNNLDSHKVPIIVNAVSLSQSYCGDFTNLDLPFLGIKKGLKAAFEKIKAGLEN